MWVVRIILGLFVFAVCRPRKYRLVIVQLSCRICVQMMDECRDCVLQLQMFGSECVVLKMKVSCDSHSIS